MKKNKRVEMIKKVMYRWNCGSLEATANDMSRMVCEEQNVCGSEGCKKVHCYPIKITIERLLKARKEKV